MCFFYKHGLNKCVLKEKTLIITTRKIERFFVETQNLPGCYYNMIRLFSLVSLMYLAVAVYAQQTPLPHGMVFGSKPDTSVIMDAAKTAGFMDKKIRITTTIKGRVTEVTKEKGGWFKLDAGRGKFITAHFKDYNVKLPKALKGRIVIMRGIAYRQFNAANGLQFSGDTTAVKEQAVQKGNGAVSFEVAGLMVYQ